MWSDHDLHLAVLRRVSVRRYQDRALARSDLEAAQLAVDGCLPLASDNRLTVQAHELNRTDNPASVPGAYGHIINAPHALFPYIVGQTAPLVDIGYRVQQVVVRMAALGLGTCYVGVLAIQPDVRQRYDVPAEAHVAAMVVMGYPSRTTAGRGFNKALKLASGATNKIPASQLYFRDTYESPSEPPLEISPLIEAGRRAPSAVNAQPWRFLHETAADRLWVLVKRQNARYGPAMFQDYRYHDGGVCMANIGFAAAALGIGLTWRLAASAGEAPFDCPPDLETLACADLQ